MGLLGFVGFARPLPPPPDFFATRMLEQGWVGCEGVLCGHPSLPPTYRRHLGGTMSDWLTPLVFACVCLCVCAGVLLQVTLADIVVFAGLFYGFKFLFDADFLASFPSVQRWFITLANQPQFEASALHRGFPNTLNTLRVGWWVGAFVAWGHIVCPIPIRPPIPSPLLAPATLVLFFG